MSRQKLFYEEPKKKLKKSNKLKSVKVPKRYRHTYDELYGLPDEKLEWFGNNGFPEERDMARGIRAERKRTRLLIYGY